MAGQGLVSGPAELALFAGAANLVWLGLGSLKAAWQGNAGPGADGGAVPPRRLLTNLLKPEVALFFLALRLLREKPGVLA